MDGIVAEADAAIGDLADRAKAVPDAQKALHYSQAALNVAHTKFAKGGRGVSAELKKRIDKAIEQLLGKSYAHQDNQRSVHCSQAAHNLANIERVLTGEKLKQSNRKSA